MDCTGDNSAPGIGARRLGDASGEENEGGLGSYLGTRRELAQDGLPKVGPPTAESPDTGAAAADGGTADPGSRRLNARHR